MVGDHRKLLDCGFKIQGIQKSCLESN